MAQSKKDLIAKKLGKHSRALQAKNSVSKSGPNVYDSLSDHILEKENHLPESENIESFDNTENVSQEQFDLPKKNKELISENDKNLEKADAVHNQKTNNIPEQSKEKDSKIKAYIEPTVATAEGFESDNLYLSDLSFAQRKIYETLIKCTAPNGITKRIRISSLSRETGIKEDSLRTLLKRLVSVGAIHRVSFKSGPKGWTIYKLVPLEEEEPVF